MKPRIIAEIAQGYEGSPVQAALLVKAAARAGADAAKLQLVYADELATSDYQHYALFRQLEMPDDVWRSLRDLARAEGIAFYVDVFGARSLALAQRIGADGVKVHSTDMSNPGLLQAIAASGVGEVLLSIGGCTAAEIDEALDRLKDRSVVLLHGFQGYPTAPDANQVQRLAHLVARYGGRERVRFGMADHAEPEDELALMLPAAALAAGASVFEKHLTLAKAMKLEDHEAALNPDEFRRFADALRRCAQTLGEVDAADPFFGMHPSERAYREKTRKHVVAGEALEAGTVLRAEHVVLKRSTSAAPIYDAREAIGRRLRKAVPADAPIAASDLEAAS